MMRTPVNNNPVLLLGGSLDVGLVLPSLEGMHYALHGASEALL